MTAARMSDGARHLAHRAGIALWDRNCTLARLQALAEELSAATRVAVLWPDASRLGEKWGQIQDRIDAMERSRRTRHRDFSGFVGVTLG
jgi:hypothetical protein